MEDKRYVLQRVDSDGVWQTEYHDHVMVGSPWATPLLEERDKRNRNVGAKVYRVVRKADGAIIDYTHDTVEGD